MKYWLILWLALGVSAYGECLGKVSLQSAAGDENFDVEVAADMPVRKQGLMFRKQLAENSGMLFLYPNAERRIFWMKNTLLPLDILFFDEGLNLETVVENAKPYDEARLHGGEDILAVLEINGGEFARKKFHSNSILKITKISGDTCPAWVLENEIFNPKNNG